ncbi:hypothetical protein GCM10027456_11920 [Kineosporia babensis]
MRSAAAWQWRWPGLAVGGIEMIEGTLIFPIEGVGVKAVWDEQDVEAARRTYPDQPVALSPDGLLILIGPHASAMAASMA